MRKHDAIDLMKLYSLGNFNKWNEMLTACFNDRNINQLARTRYQIQAGMTDLANQGMVTEELSVWYARLIRSLEQTAKKIIKVKHPMPGDNPLKAPKQKDIKAIKTKRDQELAAFLSKNSF